MQNAKCRMQNERKIIIMHYAVCIMHFKDRSKIYV